MIGIKGCFCWSLECVVVLGVGKCIVYIDNVELYFVYIVRNCVKIFYLFYINFLKVN